MYPAVTLLPSDNWCKRDTNSAAEQKAIRHYISLSQNFTFRGCGITPMKPNFDCKDVFGLSVGLESITHEGAWLFPNPASNQIQVKLSASETAEISLWDTRGRKMLSANTRGAEPINLPAELSNGFYLVRLSTDHGTQTQRLIIQR